jgi:hypothetical protein
MLSRNIIFFIVKTKVEKTNVRLVVVSATKCCEYFGDMKYVSKVMFVLGNMSAIRQLQNKVWMSIRDI